MKLVENCNVPAIVLTMIGTSRQGKSTWLNCLLKRINKDNNAVFDS